jgi:pimeloyl-ACP methyl ester carboxylesterase
MTRTHSLSRQSFTITSAFHQLAAEFILPDGVAAGAGTPTLVFLHEGLGCIAMWRDFPATLVQATHLPALVYERWGYGRSDPLPTIGARPLRYLHDEALISLPEVLAQCAIDDAIIIGHSDGGSMALMCAAAHPDKVRGVITEAAHVFVEDVTLAGIREAVKIYTTTNLKEKLTRYHGDNTEGAFRGWADTWLSPEFCNWNIEEFLPKITTPLFVIQGADDQYGTPAQVEAIAGQVKGPVKKWLVPECGHIPHVDAREAVFTEMKAFILDLLR